MTTITHCTVCVSNMIMPDYTCASLELVSVFVYVHERAFVYMGLLACVEHVSVKLINHCQRR